MADTVSPEKVSFGTGKTGRLVEVELGAVGSPALSLVDLVVFLAFCALEGGRVPLQAVLDTNGNTLTVDKLISIRTSKAVLVVGVLGKTGNDL